MSTSSYLRRAALAADVDPDDHEKLNRVLLERIRVLESIAMFAVAFTECHSRGFSDDQLPLMTKADWVRSDMNWLGLNRQIDRAKKETPQFLIQPLVFRLDELYIEGM